MLRHLLHYSLLSFPALMFVLGAFPASAQEEDKAKPEASAPSARINQQVIQPQVIQRIRKEQQEDKVSEAQHQELDRGDEARIQMKPVKPRATANTTLRRTTQTQNHAFDVSLHDCDDSNPAAHPGQAETCDGVDNDCDGDVDEGVSGTWYVDADGDGWGDPARPFLACSNQPGYAARANDCNDSDANVHPGANDPAGNGIDENCDGRDG